jgi:hypothetical protein
MFENYSELSAVELKELLLRGELNHDLMTEEDYSAIIDEELELSEPDTEVMDFCIEGLYRFDEYKELANIRIDIDALIKQQHAETTQGEQLGERKLRKSKRVAVLIAATIIGTLLIATAAAAAMGYNIFALTRQAVSSPDGMVEDDSGNRINLGDSRKYNSMQEMLAAENLDILVPTRLPGGYSFTNFEVIDSNNQFRVRMSADEPYITFMVRVGADIQIEHHDYEVNGIRYYVVELDDGLHQAGWIYNGDYYAIAVGDKAALSEIIEKLF